MIYNQDKRLVINYNDLGEPYLHKVSDNENKYKIMIAKFAIFCNHYIAFILNIIYQPTILFFVLVLLYTTIDYNPVIIVSKNL